MIFLINRRFLAIQKVLPILFLILLSTFFTVFHLDLSYRILSIEKFATMAYLVDVEDRHTESIDPRKSTSE